jgi:hypothetical protein
LSRRLNRHLRNGNQRICRPWRCTVADILLDPGPPHTASPVSLAARPTTPSSRGNTPRWEFRNRQLGKNGHAVAVGR